MLVISNRFEITRPITPWIVLHSVQLLLQSNKIFIYLTSSWNSMSTYQTIIIADGNRGSRGWTDVAFQKIIFRQIFIRHTSILVPLCFQTRWKEVSVSSEIQMQWLSKSFHVKIPNVWPLSGLNLSSEVWFQIMRQIRSTFISSKWCCYIVFRDWKSTKQTKMRSHLVYRSI